MEDQVEHPILGYQTKRQHTLLRALWIGWAIVGLGIVAAWVIGYVGLLGVSCEIPRGPSNSRGFFLNVSKGRFFLATISRPFESDGTVQCDWIPGHGSTFRLPFDRDPLTGQWILGGFEYQTFATMGQEAQGILVPCYSLVLLWAVAGWRLKRRWNRLDVGS